MQDCLFRKSIVLAIIILFIGMSVIPSTGTMIKKNCRLVGQQNSVNEITVDKICFNWGVLSKAIPIKICETENLMLTPEFDSNINRNNPAAYVRGEHVTIKAKFKSQEYSSVTIKATGSFGGFNGKKVDFNNGDSSWIFFTTINPIPNNIEIHDVSWSWQYQNPSTMDWNDFATTNHTIYALNKKPITKTVWKKLADWTTDWCNGLPDDDKQLADAILNGFVKDEVLQYCPEGGGGDMTTPSALREGGDSCGGMMNVFYDACATQGVKTIGMYFYIPSFPKTPWSEMVCLEPGLGRTEPASYLTMEMTWNLVNETYPFPSYYGFGNPNDDVDEHYFRAYFLFDHSVNLLKYKSEIYLYDLSFGKGPFTDIFDSFLLPGIHNSRILYDFRQNYHNILFDYMYGNIYYKDEQGNVVFNEDFNFSVNTSIIPDKVDGKNQFTLFITYEFFRNKDVYVFQHSGLSHLKSILMSVSAYSDFNCELSFFKHFPILQKILLYLIK